MWCFAPFRDGGWSPWVGLMAAWFYAMLATAQTRQRQRQLIAPMAAASLLWVGGQAALLWQQAPGLGRLPAFTAELADRFGVNRQSLARSLSQLEEEGIIRVDGKSIEILQPQRLSRLE